MKKILVLICITFLGFLSLLSAQQFTLNEISVSQSYIEANLDIYNNTSLPIQWDISQDPWTGLSLDGNIPGYVFLPIAFEVNIAVGETITTHPFYSGNISIGHHLVQANIYWFSNGQWAWTPVGSPVDITIPDPSGIDDQQISPVNIRAYPNPFLDALNISFVKETPGNVSCDVFNIKGQKVYHNSITARSGSNEFTWNGHDLNNKPCTSGIYIIKLNDGKRVQPFKGLKVR
jgi:hypothetical protein